MLVTCTKPFRVLLIFSSFVISQAAFGAASAIAFSSDGAWGWATGATQLAANKQALRGCKSAAKNNDCKLKITKALAEAKGGSSIGYARSDIGLADAKSKAIKACGKEECKIVFETALPGFYSLFQAENDKQLKGDYFLVYNYSDSDLADKESEESCEQKYQEKCGLVWSGAIPGEYKFPATNLTPETATISTNNCRPNTKTIRCTSQCSNGDCVVLYENGCRLRVQVQPNFDPFTNQWVYPAPNC